MDVGYFIWLAVESVAVLAIFPPALFLLAVSLLGVVQTAHYVPLDRRRQALATTLLTLALPLAILLCGVLLKHDGELQGSARDWPEWLVEGLFVAHLPLAALLMAMMRGIRWFVLSISGLCLGYSCGAAFMSIMSVTDTWL